MRTVHTFSALALLGALAACSPGNPTAVNAGPMSSQPQGAASQMPQAPNSLPVGSTTAAPITGPAGNVSTTTVNPMMQQGNAVPGEATQMTQDDTQRARPARRRTARRAARRNVRPATQSSTTSTTTTTTTPQQQ